MLSYGVGRWAWAGRGWPMSRLAVVNLASVNNTIAVTAHDNQGNTLGTGSIPLGPNAKAALVLRNIPGLAVAGAIGSVDFTAPIGNVAALGLRFNGRIYVHPNIR